MSGLTTPVLVVTGLAVIASLYLRSRKNYLPLPPSPKGVPIFGNLFQLPQECGWDRYEEWSKEIGSDIIHLNLAGMTMIVLNSERAMLDLFEKRSLNYASRPSSPMLGLVGWNDCLVVAKYGETWREQRRMVQHEFDKENSLRFHPQLGRATQVLLGALLERPEDWHNRLRFMAAGQINNISYAIDCKPDNDPYIALSNQANLIGVEGGEPWKYMVNVMPWLDKVPDWVPGTGWKETKKKWQKLTEEVLAKPFDKTKEDLANGIHRTSFVRSCLESMDDKKDQDTQVYNIKWAAATVFLGGVETVLGTLGAFVLAMVEHPEVVRRAQEEIDRVIAPGHLPDFGDEASMPYMTAVIREVLRWKPVTPVAFPHTATEEDVYRGYRIPAGSIVISNVHSVLHDETLYPNPDKFNPSRFIGKDGKLDPNVYDPGRVCFGLGRRICPGQHVTYATLFVTMAGMLSVFNITKARAADGSIIEPNPQFINNLSQLVKPFPCSITPRSQEKADLVRSIVLSGAE